jgi:hypothetical protein
MTTCLFDRKLARVKALQCCGTPCVQLPLLLRHRQVVFEHRTGCGEASNSDESLGLLGRPTTDEHGADEVGGETFDALARVCVDVEFVVYLSIADSAP